MKRILVLAAALVAAAACRAEPPARDGMTAEEHARMTAGPAPERQPVRLSVEQARSIGVTFTTVERGPLTRTVRTVGQVVPAEPNLAEITAKVDGFVEELYVNATGASVRRGQPLLTLYSPMLVAAQEELLAAASLAATVDTNDGQALLEAARRRLAFWDIPPEQIARLERTGEVTKALPLNAPVDGVVLEKMVVAGQAVMAGMKLYRVADLTTVWIEAAVFEQDVGVVRVGAAASVELAAYPGRPVAGRVSFVWPTVDEASRSVRVRVAVANPSGALKPGMYATLVIAVRIGAGVLSVPADAVVMTGARDLVFVLNGDGSLTPREVVLGARAGDRVEILRGVAMGERLVASANFLVDAESRLGGAGPTGTTGMPGMPEHKP